MIVNLLPLYLTNVLGVQTAVIGLIEGIAEATASLLKLYSGWLSDQLGARKWLAVTGYAFSSLSKPFFYFASSWGSVAAIRWADRVGKGIRTAPRDALIADSVSEQNRGFAFGVQRTFDTAGAFVGLVITFGVVWYLQASNLTLTRSTFQTLVLISLLPALLAVLVLAIGTQETARRLGATKPQWRWADLNRSFLVLMLIIGLFDLGNSSDAFLILRAQERGVSVLGVLGILILFNFIYTLVSAPAGWLSDRIERRHVIIGAWVAYALIYLGFALARQPWHIWLLYAIYGVYYGLAYGTAKALVADVMPPERLGTAYGIYNAILGVIDLPASLIAGVLWQGLGSWSGFGPSAPFYFGAMTALAAAIALWFWRPNRI